MFGIDIVALLILTRRAVRLRVNMKHALSNTVSVLSFRISRRTSSGKMLRLDVLMAAFESSICKGQLQGVIMPA
jgi:hypothetical protein